jgi:2-polyprenyl-6-methoxyphenol hydroxylase-like FAD-dependent oxidoreductase
VELDDSILIVGGGLGGLTAALALARRGRSVRVLEGAPAFGAIGYGIQSPMPWSRASTIAATASR